MLIPPQKPFIIIYKHNWEYFLKSLFFIFYLKIIILGCLTLDLKNGNMLLETDQLLLQQRHIYWTVGDKFIMMLFLEN